MPGPAAELARSFLALPRPEPPSRDRTHQFARSSRAAFRHGEAAPGTLAEAYLRSRGMMDLRDCGALRLHPRCYYYRGDQANSREKARETWPALIAAVTTCPAR